MPDQETWQLFGDKNIVKGALTLIGGAIKILITVEIDWTNFTFPTKAASITWNKRENGLLFCMGLDFIPLLNLKQLPSWNL